jgi:cytochrome b involved in lipid metabolism
MVQSHPHPASTISYGALPAYFSQNYDQRTPEQFPSTPAAPLGSKRYTMEEVARHATKEDAWVVIEGKVYDITNFVKVRYVIF